MKIAINAISATAGGGRTYLLNLARALPLLGEHQYRLYAPAAAASDLPSLPGNCEVLPEAARGNAARFAWEQFSLPSDLRGWAADVLICLGNFCPLRCSVPVVLLSRNALYFTPRFIDDLLERRHYFWAARHKIMARLALASARAAKLTITPTAAMAGLISAASANRPVALRTISHGFELWPSADPRHAAAPAPPFRFLLVSHYNYFRNFETVLRAFAELQKNYGNGHCKLMLTTNLQPGLRLGGYDTTSAHRLLRELGLQDAVTTLGAIPYDELPEIYRSAHAVICPAYAESFSHTVVEAMAMGVPVIASDIPAHREVAGEAAVFFSPLDAADLARRCRAVMEDDSLRSRLEAAGRERVLAFSWRRHFEALLAAAAEVAA